MQPFYPLTSKNHSALVVVAAVIFLIYAIIGVGVKLLIRLSLTSIKGHDIVLLVAGAVYCIQTAFVIVACNHGLGQHRSDVSANDFDQFSIVRVIRSSREQAFSSLEKAEADRFHSTSMHPRF